MRLLSAQLREHQRATVALGQHVSLLEALLLDRTGADVEALHERVARELGDVDPRARSLLEAANINGELVARMADTVHEISQLRVQKLNWDATLRDTSQALKNTEDRVALGGNSEGGRPSCWPRSANSSLPTAQARVGRLQTGYAQTRISLIDVRERQNTLVTSARPAAPRSHGCRNCRTTQPRVARRFYRVLGTRAAGLVQLGAAKQAGRISQAEPELRNLIDTTAKLSRLLGSRLLWTPSHTPADQAWLR